MEHGENTANTEKSNVFSGGVLETLNEIENLPEESKTLLKNLIRNYQTDYPIRQKRNATVENLISLGYVTDVTDNEAILNQEYDKNALFRELSKRGYDFKMTSATTKREMIEYLKTNERALKNLTSKYIDISYTESFRPLVRSIREVLKESEREYYTTLEECYNEVKRREDEQKNGTANVRTTTHVIEIKMPELDGGYNIERKQPTDKKKITALLLCIFGGYFGLHQFYVGKIGIGILYLCTVGVFGVGWVVDIIRIATGKFKDKSGQYLK